MTLQFEANLSRDIIRVLIWINYFYITETYYAIFDMNTADKYMFCIGHIGYRIPVKHKQDIFGTLAMSTSDITCIQISISDSS